jgi:hypothetical protein
VLDAVSIMIDEACNSHDVSYLQQPRISPEELRVMNWKLGIASTGHLIARKSGCGFESARSAFSSQNWCLGDQSGRERERESGAKV